MKTYYVKYESEHLAFSKLWISKTVLVQAKTVSEATNKTIASGVDPERILEVMFSTLEIVV